MCTKSADLARDYTLSFRWTGNACAALLLSTHSALAILITDRKYRERYEATEAVLETKAAVEFTTELASVWASAVDYSDSAMC